MCFENDSKKMANRNYFVAAAWKWWSGWRTSTSWRSCSRGRRGSGDDACVASAGASRRAGPKTTSASSATDPPNGTRTPYFCIFKYLRCIYMLDNVVLFVDNVLCHTMYIPGCRGWWGLMVSSSCVARARVTCCWPSARTRPGSVAPSTVHISHICIFVYLYICFFSLYNF